MGSNALQAIPTKPLVPVIGGRTAARVGSAVTMLGAARMSQQTRERGETQRAGGIMGKRACTWVESERSTRVDSKVMVMVRERNIRSVIRERNKARRCKMDPGIANVVLIDISEIRGEECEKWSNEDNISFHSGCWLLSSSFLSEGNENR